MFSFPRDQRIALRHDCSSASSIQHRPGKNGSAGPNCTVLTLNLAKADRTNRAFKVVQCDQTSPFADSMMLSSEEVRRPLQRPVSFLLTSEVQHVNHIDRSFGAVFARWRGLGILSLPRLGRTRDAHLTHLDGVHEGSGLGGRPRALFEFFQHM